MPGGGGGDDDDLPVSNNFSIQNIKLILIFRFSKFQIIAMLIKNVLPKN